MKYVKEFRALVKDVDGRRDRRRAAVHRASRRGRGRAQQQRRRRRAGPVLGARGRVHRRGQRADDRGAGAEYVIIGHSERRTLFGETDATVNRKMTAAFARGLTPIVCIGETLDQRERNETLDVLDRQIKAGLDGLTGEQLGSAGARLRAGLGDRHRPQRHAGAGRRGARHIRERLRQWFGAEAAELCQSSTAAA